MMLHHTIAPQQEGLEGMYQQLQAQNNPEAQMRGAEQFQHLRAGEAGEGYARALGFPSLQAYQVAEQIRERQANEELRRDMYGAREQHMQMQDAVNPNLQIAQPNISQELLQKMYPTMYKPIQPQGAQSGLAAARQALGVNQQGAQ